MDDKFLYLIEDTRFTPVFVMGDHRSGTTILCNLLAKTGLFNVVNAYHIINSDRLLEDYESNAIAQQKECLNLEFEKRGIKKRGIDKVGISSETIEEYAYIFKGSGYRPQLNPGNREDLNKLCKKVVLTGSEQKPVLLKNPWDFSNFVYVKKAFPDSRFIFIHRNPLWVINSQLRATRDIYRSKNEYIAMIVKSYDRLYSSPIKRNLFRLLFSSRIGLSLTMHHVEKFTQYYLDNIAHLPAGDIINLRYEDLCDDADDNIQRILDWLDVGGTSKEQAFARHISPRKDPLLPEVRAKEELIRNRMGAYMHRFSYA